MCVVVSMFHLLTGFEPFFDNQRSPYSCPLDNLLFFLILNPASEIMIIPCIYFNGFLEVCKKVNEV